MSPLPEPETINRFADCVAMKLHFDWAKVNEDSQPPISFLQTPEQDVNKTEIEVSLTINFSGEQEMKVPGAKLLGIDDGKVTFGVKRGRLQLNLDNCKMPLETIALNKAFRIVIDVETQTEQGTEIQIGGSIGRKSGEEFNAASTAGLRAGGKLVEKMNRELSQVSQTGSEETPAWIFEVQEKNLILEGALIKSKLGTLHPHVSPCQAVATFKVRSEDIQLTWGRMGLTKDIIRNKLAVIERALALRYIGPQLESVPVSEVRWHHG